MSAYWLSVNSFGPPHVLIGLTVLWMNRRGITPPTFIAHALWAWTVIGVVAAGPGIGQDLILLVASGRLVAGARRTEIRHVHPPDRPPASFGPGARALAWPSWIGGGREPPAGQLSGRPAHRP